MSSLAMVVGIMLGMAGGTMMFLLLLPIIDKFKAKLDAKRGKDE